MVYAGTGTYKNVYSTMAEIATKEGIFVLWSSWKTRVMYITIGGMIFFGTFENASVFINKLLVS